MKMEMSQFFLFLSFTFLITFSCISLISGDDESDPGDVTVLTDSNFEEYVGTSKHVFVKFYAPWCGHCKSMAPAWKEVATEYSNSADVIIAKLDATEHGEKARQMNVSGYPTLKYFAPFSKEGENYKGGRTQEALKSWVEEKTDALHTGKLGQLTDVMRDFFTTCEKGDEGCKTTARKAFESAIDSLDGKYDKLKHYYRKKILGQSEMEVKWNEMKDSWSKESQRLQKMMSDATSASSLKKDAKQWIQQRVNILKHAVEVLGEGGGVDAAVKQAQKEVQEEL